MPWQGDELTGMVWGGLNLGFMVLTCCPCGLFSKQLEEEEQEDKFDLTVGVSDPEKVGEFLSCTVKGSGEPGLALQLWPLGCL